MNIKALIPGLIAFSLSTAGSLAFGQADLSVTSLRTGYIDGVGQITLKLGAAPALVQDANQKWLDNRGREVAGSTLMAFFEQPVQLYLLTTEGNTNIYNIYFHEVSPGASSLSPTGYRLAYNQMSNTTTASLLKIENGKVMASFPLYPVITD